ncbi:helix-turn-helix domain-containing protein [Robiginitalea sediminis]|uniref:helix-turn-helix domain-containing protein n=1 Tax=Robiginitalea sediminis TaxID=1982593 RepID=UPI000B4A6949
MANEELNERFLTRREVAEKFRVNESTVYRWRQKGIIKAYGIQGRVLYKQSEIQKQLIEL